MRDTNEQFKKSNEEGMKKTTSHKHKSNRLTAMEVMDNMNKVPEESTSKSFFLFPKTTQLDGITNYGEFPLRTYEMLRNSFVGII